MTRPSDNLAVLLDRGIIDNAQHGAGVTLRGMVASIGATVRSPTYDRVDGTSGGRDPVGDQVYAAALRVRCIRALGNGEARRVCIMILFEGLSINDVCSVLGGRRVTTRVRVVDYLRDGLDRVEVVLRG